MGLELDARSVLIPIDVQQGFDLSPGNANNPAMEANGLRLLAAWREARLPLVHVRHDSVVPGSRFRPGTPGHAFRPGFAPRDGEALVAKSVNAAFIGTDLDLRLRRMGVEQVVLFGLVTDMCVSTTARVAANLGYRTVVVGDACSSIALRDVDGSPLAAADVHRIHLATLHEEFGTVVGTEGVLAALAARAATAA